MKANEKPQPAITGPVNLQSTSEQMNE